MDYIILFILILINIPFIKSFDINVLAIGILLGLIIANLAFDSMK
jgi:hypothetical protein